MRALTLEYHDVFVGKNPDDSGFAGAGPASYKVPLDVFERHISAMAERRLTVHDAIQWLENGGEGTPLFLTFDDGGRGALHAADTLESKGWRGHFLVTTGRIGSKGFLTAPQLGELSRRRHLIGTHSVTHPKMMGKLSPDEILSEWRDSKAILEDVLASPVLIGSVPGGFYTRQVGEAAAATGLKVLFTSNPTTAVTLTGDCIVLGRYTIRSGTPASTATALAEGVLAPRIAQRLIYGGLTLLRSIAGNRYTRVRDMFWSGRAP